MLEEAKQYKPYYDKYNSLKLLLEESLTKLEQKEKEQDNFIKKQTFE